MSLCDPRPSPCSRRYVAAAVLALLIFSPSAGAATIYVDVQLADDCTNGEYSIANRDDSGSDGDAYNCLTDVEEILAPGDTLYVRGGEYDSPGGSSTHPMLKLDDLEATEESPVLVSNYNGESVVLDGEYEKDYGIGLTECKWITVHGFEFTRFNRGGVNIYTSGTVAGAEYITVEYCEAHDCCPSLNKCAFVLIGPGHHITFRYLLAHNNALGIAFREAPNLAGSTYRIPPTSDAPEYEEDMPEEDWDSWEGWTPYSPRYCTMQNCIAYEHEGANSEHSDGIYSRYTIESVFEDNISFRNTDDNMDMLAPTRITFRRNIAFDGDPNNDPDGDGNGIKIGVRGGLDCLVHHNVSFGNRRMGLDMADSCRSEVYNNTCYNNTNYGIWTEDLRSSQTGQTFLNNIVANNGGGTVNDMGSLQTAPGVTINIADYNCISDDNTDNNAIDQGSGSLISTDPLFVDADSTVDTDFPSGLSIPEKLTYIRDQVEGRHGGVRVGGHGRQQRAHGRRRQRRYDHPAELCHVGRDGIGRRPARPAGRGDHHLVEGLRSGNGHVRRRLRGGHHGRVLRGRDVRPEARGRRRHARPPTPTRSRSSSTPRQATHRPPSAPAAMTSAPSSTASAWTVRYPTTACRIRRAR